MATEVSVLDKNGNVTFYSTYLDARNAAGNNTGDHDLIQIWSDLNEQIVLKNGVDIWIAEGVVLNNLVGSLTSSFITITDNGQECHCKIYGMGIIKSTFAGSSGSPVYECIKTTDPDTELSVECDYIEGIGGITTNIIMQPSIFIENASKFHLECNQVINEKTCSIALGLQPNFVQNVISDVNIKVCKIDISGESITNSESIAVSVLAHGFIEIDEIICRHYGHCLLHAVGDIVASIRKMSNVNNHSTNNYATVIVSHGNNQKLSLYFDELISLKTSGVSSSGPAIISNQGVNINLIGRKIFAEQSITAYLQGTNVTGIFKISEIISQASVAMVVNVVNQFTIDSAVIQGVGGTIIYSSGSAQNPGNYTLLNAKLINLQTSGTPRGIYLENIFPQVTLKNIKIVCNDDIIFLNSEEEEDQVFVKNYGLFGNNNFDDTKIILQIGDANNYLFTENSNLT